jgi:hypothetical protein
MSQIGIFQLASQSPQITGFHCRKLAGMLRFPFAKTVASASPASAPLSSLRLQ